MLKANNIHKKYGQLEVLKGITTTIHTGELSRLSVALVQGNQLF